MTPFSLLIIPAIALRVAVFVPDSASPAAHQRCVDQNVCKYALHNVIAAHDYLQFERLHELEIGDRVTLRGIGRFRVTAKNLVHERDTRALNTKEGEYRLQTCVENVRYRLIVTLSRL